MADKAQAEWTKLKARLTKAVNSGDPDKIIEEANHGLARFEVIGYPDYWSNWERARDDASIKKQFAAGKNPFVAGRWG